MRRLSRDEHAKLVSLWKNKMGCELSTLWGSEEPKNAIRLHTPLDAPQRKVILVGDISVGKSSLVQRLLGKGFREEHVSTIGTAFASVTLEYETGKPPVVMHVWDTAGEERFRSMSRYFFRGTNVGILVFDVQVKESLEKLSSWHEDIVNAAPEAQYIVAANKIDSVPELRAVSTEEGSNFAKSINALYVETSAKTEEGVIKLFQTAASICASLDQTSALTTS